MTLLYHNHPINDKNSKNSIPGWNQYVKPYKELSIYGANIWKENGFPVGDKTDNDRKLACFQYNRTIKFAKQHKKIIVKKISNTLFLRNFNCFWKEIKKNKINSINTLNIIDNAVDSYEISQLIKKNYKNLYNL